MSCRLLFCLAAFLGLTAGCGRRAEAPAARLAVLRFENTGSNTADDWMGRVLSEAVAGSLSRAGVIDAHAIRELNSAMSYRPAAAPGISAERTQAVLAGAGLIGYGAYRQVDGRVTARLTVQSVQGNRTVREIEASGPPAELLAIAESIARQWSPQAEAYPTRNLEAARAYAAAVEASSPDAAVQAVERAAAADPAFAPAHLLLSQSKAARQDRAGAEAVLRALEEHAADMSPAWRARTAFELASLRGDAAGRERALNALAEATPRDPLAWRATGDAAFARRDMQAAIAAYRKTLALTPDNLPVLNQAGYALTALGDWKGALEMLNRYRALQPGDANPIDSLGDIHLQTGRFEEAARFFEEAHRKNPAFFGGRPLYKAAVARLMGGDIAAADSLAKQFIEARQAAGDPIVEYRKADWSWMSGRRKEGFERLSEWAASAANGPAREMAARAYAQLAVWSMALGRTEEAAGMASRATVLAGRSPVSATAAMAAFLAQPAPNASEMAVRAERAFGGGNAPAGFGRYARAYSLLLAGDFKTAVPLLREMYQSGDGGDPGLPVLLAWAYLETGRTSDAAPLLALYPVPPDGPAVFNVMSFPRVLYLRGVLAERQGQAESARQSFRTFLQLSGGVPLRWGEEAAAASKAR